MAKVTIAYGSLLFVLGFVGFAMTGFVHYTALIPVAIGSVMVVLGVLALARPAWRMHVMHVAVLLALVSVIATVSAIPDAIQWMKYPVIKQLEDSKVLLENNNIIRPAAAISKSIMAILSAIYMALAIQSFVAARIKRNSQVPGFKPEN